jgi:hypothetical protein
LKAAITTRTNPYSATIGTMGFVPLNAIHQITMAEAISNKTTVMFYSDKSFLGRNQ